MELTRRERHKERRREAIEAAALHLFAQQGVERTTVEQITEQADVAKGTFFNYFENKHDVLAVRLRRLANGFLAHTEAETEGEPLDRLVSFFRRVEKLFEAEGAGLLNLYREVFNRPHLAGIDEQVETQVMEFYRDIIRRGLAAGVVRDNVDPDLAARLIMDIWSATLRTWICGRRFGLAQELERKLNALFEGLRQKPASARPGQAHS